MATACLVDPLLGGRQALQTSRWEDARAAFEQALAAQETPDARCDEAARMGVWVSHRHFVSGRASAARGWLARAERALEGAEPCAGQGWVAVEQQRAAPQRGHRRPAHARRVPIAIGRKAA